MVAKLNTECLRLSASPALAWSKQVGYSGVRCQILGHGSERHGGLGREQWGVNKQPAWNFPFNGGSRHRHHW